VEGWRKYEPENLPRDIEMPSLFDETPNSIEEVRSIWRSCTACVFASMWRETGPCLPSTDTHNKTILVVGQWPGARDMENRVPFSGKQGKVAIEMMIAAGFHREELYPTNVLLCGCPGEPSKDTLSNCRDQIDQTLDVIQPKLVVALGRHAAHRFGVRLSMKQSHGKTFRYRSFIVTVCTHPAAINRASSREAKRMIETEVRADLRKAYKLYLEEVAEKPSIFDEEEDVD
jgi:uracil-DNA glycosylase